MFINVLNIKIFKIFIFFFQIWKFENLEIEKFDIFVFYKYKHTGKYNIEIWYCEEYYESG